ncbi:MAG TPA: hypothetical protein PK064_09845 [Bacteroidales bacterium]|nr:hypothetical protein [Bacteroidales bacterium]
MLKKLIITCLALIFASGSAFTQGRKVFSGEREKFSAELAAYMGPNLTPDQSAILSKFTSSWDSAYFSSDIAENIMGISSLLAARNFRPVPHFIDFLKTLLDLSQYKGNKGYFLTWLTGLVAMIHKPAINNDNIDRHLRNTSSFVTSGIVFESATVKWKIKGQNTTFEYDTSFFINAQNVTLTAFSQKDSIEIYDVTGKYFPENTMFRGVIGTVYFEKAGYPRNEAFAEIRNYSINLQRAAYEVDSALFTYKTFFEKPEYGKLTDQVSLSGNRENIRYPRFETYTKTFAIKNIFKDVNYEGGIRLEGSTVIGMGDVFTPARITIFRNDTLYLKVAANTCLITRGGINTQESSATFYLGNDSIHHSSIGFSYNAENREINLFRSNNPIAKSPWFDSFHGFDIYFENLIWNMNQSTVILSRSRGASLGQARFESASFFNSTYFERLAGIDEYHPLYRLRQFADWFYSNTFPVKEFAKWMKKPEEAVTGLCIDLTNRGFLFYDRVNNEVTIKSKVDDFINAYAKKKDYDVISFMSETNAPVENAFLDLNSFRLTVNGVRNIFLSDSQMVSLYPYNQRIEIGKNRKISFDGVVEAGLFTIFGHNFVFDYDTFKINLHKIDSIRIAVETGERDAMGRPLIKDVENLIQLTTAELYIDDPKNKSGLRSLKQYPIINATTYSYIFYDKIPGLEGIYKQQDFYFRIEPFTYDNIDHYTNEMMNLPGEFHAGNIIKPTKQYLIIQEDNSLGFTMNIPSDGIEVYDGKGRLYNMISMSNKGLTGSGKLRRITSETESDEFRFFPDSMITFARSFTISPDGSGRFPVLSSNDVSVKWLTSTDEWIASNAPGKKFDMFGNGTQLDGKIILTPERLSGSGIIDITDSRIISNKFNFAENIIQSDTADYNLKSTRGEAIGFLAENVNVTIDFNSYQSKFSLNTGTSLVKFPEIQYICTMTDFQYDMKNRILNMEQRGKAETPLMSPEELLKLDFNKLDKPTFFATNIIKDTIAFTSWKGRYDLNQEVVIAENINYIHIADALIQPDKGRITIERGARIQPLQNAVIAVNNKHLLHSGNIVIENTRSYSGSATYNYVDESGNIQQINFPKITSDKGITSATGYIPVTQNFMLSPAFTFTGDVMLSAQDDYLTFTGAAGIVHNCSFKSYNVKFKSSINPKMVIIPIAEKVRDINDNPVYSGSFISTDSAHIYPAFLSERKSWSDAQIVNAQGALWYEKEKGVYRIASMEKLADLSLPGNMITLDKNYCILSGEGQLNFGANYDHLKMAAAGKVIHNIDSGKVNFEAVIALDFYFSPQALEMMSNEIRRVPALAPVNLNTEFYKKAMKDLLGESVATRINEEIGLFGTTRNLPREYPYELLLNDVKLYWNEPTSSFRSKGKIGIGLIGSNAVNVYVDGFIEIQRRRSGDMLDIYLKADNSTWYYFSYFRGVLMTQSSNLEYNTLISTLKEKVRTHPESSTRVPYTYMIAVEDRLPRFLQRMTSDQAEEQEQK